jgi:hypothetical protein
VGSVICVVGYFHICVFEYFSDVSGFLANIGKCRPFIFGSFYCESLAWFCLNFLIYPWLNWEGIIV